jgi:hypothetical protein
MAKRRAGFSNISITKNWDMDPFDLAALIDGIDELYRNVSNENIRKGSVSIDRLKIQVLTDIIISDANETKIPHKLGIVPVIMSVTPKAENTWWQTKSADKGFVYLQASTAGVKHDIVLIA